MHVPNGTYGLFLICGKKGVSCLHKKSPLFYYEVISSLIDYQKLIHAWAAMGLLALSKWVCPVLCPKADLFRPCDFLDASKSFPRWWLGLSILRLACPDLATDLKSQNQAHINHTDKHHKLRQNSSTVTIYNDPVAPWPCWRRQWSVSGSGSPPLPHS